MKLPRRTFLHLAAGAAALPAVSRIARAQSYPTKPVRWIVPFAAGGPNDILARLLGQWLSERLGQPFIVENRPGAGGNIGTEAVVRAPPDGHTILMIATPQTINVTLYENLNFNFIRDIAPIATLIHGPLVIVVNPLVPAKTVPDPPISYLVGTPKGRLSKLEKDLLTRPWQAVREGVDVKLLPQDQELYVLAQSRARIHKERAMRRRKLKWLWARLKQIAAMDIDREELLMKLGAARAQARAAWRLIDVAVAPHGATFSFALNRKKLSQVRRREGRYLLRTNLCGKDPAQLWQFYIQLVEVEAAFKTMKDDLQLRPIYHQLEERIEAHIFVAFLAYCLHLTLRARLKPLAPGLTPRAVLDKLAAVQMLDVHFPTTDGRTLILSRYTELSADQKLLVKKLNLDLPPQPPPRITAPGTIVPVPTHAV